MQTVYAIVLFALLGGKRVILHTGDRVGDMEYMC